MGASRGVLRSWARAVLASLAMTMVALAGFATPAMAYRASIVIDADSGMVLEEKRADHRHYPASLSKMMTLYLLFEAIDAGRVTLATPMRVSKRAAGQPKSKLGVKAGSTITVHQAIQALIVRSANDVATVIAEALGGEEWKFAALMTRKARELGMRRTSFRNASGLPNRRQLTTARDMAILARALYRDFPHHYHYFATRSFRYKGKTYQTYNRLLTRYPGADGLKTGYIRASGFNLAFSAERGGKRLIGVVLGGGTPGSRDRAMARLLDRGFASVRRAYAKLPPPPPAKPILVAEGDWAVQVGAFGDLGSALAALRATRVFVPPSVALAKAMVVPAEQGDGGLYRARFVGVPVAQARRACLILARKGRDCEVVRHTPDTDAISMGD